jgi:NAD-reducing hydrogenase large subunit
MPGITPRICGICPVSHLLASAKAGDAIMAVNIPPAADKLRRLMNLGQIVQSHALELLSFERAGLSARLGHAAGAAQRFRPDCRQQGLARAGIRLRQFGQEIIEILGGKKIHPAWAVPGGVRSALTEEGRAKIRAWLPEAFATTKVAFDLFKKTMETHQREIQIFGNFPSLFMGLVAPDGTWEHHGGKLRFTDSSGSIIADQLDPQNITNTSANRCKIRPISSRRITSRSVFPDGMYRVGPLARLNVCEQMGVPKADAELKNSRKSGAARSRRHSCIITRGSSKFSRRSNTSSATWTIRNLLERLPPRRRRHQQPARRGRERSPARHAVPRLHGGPQRPACKRSISSSPPARTTWR